MPTAEPTCPRHPAHARDWCMPRAVAADWHASIRSAPTLADALDRFEEAIGAGVDVGALLALQQ